MDLASIVLAQGLLGVLYVYAFTIIQHLVFIWIIRLVINKQIYSSAGTLPLTICRTTCKKQAARSKMDAKGSWDQIYGCTSLLHTARLLGHYGALNIFQEFVLMWNNSIPLGSTDTPLHLLCPFLLSPRIFPTLPTVLSYSPHGPFLLSPRSFPTLPTVLSYSPHGPFLLSPRSFPTLPTVHSSAKSSRCDCWML
jgi:hypothetical protein